MTIRCNDLEKYQLIEKNMLPLLKSYCIEHPIRIEYQKLSQITATHCSFSIIQLSWLQGISEMNIADVNSINWDDPNLYVRVMEIQNLLYKVSEYEYGRSDILINGEHKKLQSRYFSPKLAIKLLNVIKFINCEAEPKEKEKDTKRAWQNLYDYRLADINLTHELRIGLRDYCKNKPVLLILNHLPKILWLKYLAHYLAISAKSYSDYGDVDYDDTLLINNAIGIHKILREELNNMLNIHLKSLALMSPDERKIAVAHGVLQINIVATNPIRAISDDLSVEVTKELALRLLERLPEFSYLFDNKEEKSVLADDVNGGIPNRLSTGTKPSSVGHDTTRHLKLAVELILTDNPDHVLMPKALWKTLLTKENYSRYKIKSVHGEGASQKIEFQCGHITDYHAAQVHIQNVIAWYKSTKKH